jgi:putative hemolysin
MLELSIIIFLALLNGVFAGTETAMISARRGRLEQLAASGNLRADAAMHLQADPNRFLATVQVGITLIATISGVFGGASLAGTLAPLIGDIPLLAPYADTLALVLVIALITYLSLVLGELVPKRIALQNAEAIAALMARPMNVLAAASRPVIGLLTWSTETVLTLLGRREHSEEMVTEDDILYAVCEGADSGTVAPEERDIVELVFDLGDRSVRQIMTPRRDMYVLCADDILGAVIDDFIEQGYSRVPLYRENSDNIVGVVHARDILRGYRSGELDQPLSQLMHTPLFVPENSRAAALLPTFRKQQRHLALAVGELGGIEGLVTLEDVLEEIIGEINDEHDVQHDEAIIRRADGSFLAEGTLPIDRLKDLLQVEALPNEEEYRYDTLAGFVLSLLGQIPRSGQFAVWNAWRFEVVDMDGLRIDKVLIARQAPEEHREELDGR